MSRRLTTISALCALGVAGLNAGCGGGQEATTTPIVPAAAKPVRSLNVSLSDFKISPILNVVSAGKVTINARNLGGDDHELIVVRTSDPTKLPLKHGRVNEDGLGARIVGEIPELKPGVGGAKTFTLRPGTYVLFCNVPGHYRHGMYARLAVR
jgi:uncharacterized cupredoxin-like copper-binding protein